MEKQFNCQIKGQHEVKVTGENYILSTILQTKKKSAKVTLKKAEERKTQPNSKSG